MCRKAFLAGVASVALLLSGCSTGGNAMVDSLRAVLKRGDSDAVQFDPNFEYLRITRDSHVGWLWLGSTEKSPEGLVHVYYSKPGEVLRLQNGRLVGLSGLSTEWRGVRHEGLPSWDAIAAAGKPLTFVRWRDVMPGYRFGIRDELIVRRTTPPSRTQLKGLDPARLTWFEEITRPGDGAAAENLPVARYAVELSGGEGKVMYAEQCVAADVCFTWQRWSAAMQQSAGRS